MAVERYRVQVDGKWMDVALERTGEHMKVQIGDKTWDADMERFLDTNLVSLILGGNSLSFLVEKIDDTWTVLREWENYKVRVKPAWAGTQGAAEREDYAPSETTIDSPLVGVIAQVAATPGQKVERGDLLIVIEAMKMQNELRAPRAGIVRSVRVRQGQKVALRQPLVVLM
ncbi:MAG: biotin/lipoyl-binding protein [Chloroflexi bacterium]|nr:biotin/lipoyl-binding protein [Chloroflexota bacterium]